MKTLSQASNSSELKICTIDRIEEALEQTELVSSAKVIRLIQDISTKASDISIEELSELVNRDVTVTRKVMVSANKLGVNPLGATVQTVSQAVHMVGFNKIRNLAVSLLLMKNSSEMANYHLQKEVSAKALCSGIVAQEILQAQSEDLGERAFICATLRNYGNLLLSTFLPYEYEQALDYMEVLNENAAYRKVFGALPIELSYYFLKKEKMPEEILKTLKYVSLGVAGVENRRDEDRLMVVADFSMKFCDIMSDTKLSAGAFSDRSNDLLGRYRKNVKLGPKGVEGLLTRVVESLEDFSDSYGFNLFHDEYFGKLKSRSDGEEPKQEVVHERIPAPQIMPPFSEETETPKRDYLVKGLERLTRIVGDKPTRSGPLYEVTMQSLIRGLEMESIVLFGVHARDKALRVMAGCGSFYHFAKEVPFIPAQDKDLFGLCVKKGMDAIFQDSRIQSTQKWMPVWMNDYPTISAMIMLPIQVNGNTVGFICMVNINDTILDLETSRVEVIRKIAKKLNEGVAIASAALAKQSG